MAVRTDTLNDVLGQVVSTDEDIKKRVTKIVNALLNDVEWIIRHGTVKDRIALARSVVPPMMKALTAQEGSDSEMKQRYAELLSDLRGDTDLGGAE